MPQTPHVERHFTAGETVRDLVIGMSDGLTVPFALAAGLSRAVASTRIVVTGPRHRRLATSRTAAAARAAPRGNGNRAGNPARTMDSRSSSL